ncbi:helix-turn-helix domain-containing protein [Pseudomonas sp.]|uniref:helix-turn-helix domain-containing protein n=1 Tax=Pseudomonas sp. TaxID=306 RepID=UPI0035241FFA
MPAFANACQIHQVQDLSTCALQAESRQPPDMICMHYDRPDALGLDLLQQVKRSAPSIPITMLTVQHSEELAVWAFRSGVWEYLLLPVLQPELSCYLRALRELCQLRRNPQASARKQPLSRSNALPECVRLTTQYQHQQPLQGAVYYIEEHFQEHLEQKEMAQRCGMTPFRFSRLFKQTYGVGFLEFVLCKRMEKAEELLCNSQMPVTSIAYAVGFQDPSYFPAPSSNISVAAPVIFGKRRSLSTRHQRRKFRGY